MSLLDDARVLLRSGFLRPVMPSTAMALTRQFLKEGAKPHLVYTLHGRRQPNRAALIYDGRTTTWGQLLDRTNRLANHFLSKGIGPGTGVTVMLPNVPEFIEANAAALRIGATVSFVNPRAPAADARDLVARTKSGIIVTHRNDLDAPVPVLPIGEFYERAIANAPARDPNVPRHATGKVVIFTSGTTGRPKGAVRSMDASSASPTAFLGFLRTIPFQASDVHLVTSPMYHSAGSGFATSAQALGNTLVMVERFSPESFCRNVAEHRVTTTTVVPTMLHQLAEWPDVRKYDLSSLRVVVCTGSPLREEVRDAARELLGEIVYDLYGSTEQGWVSIATPKDQRDRPGTVGKPAAGVDVKIRDPDGADVPRGERGEVWAKSQLGMSSYIDDPELTSARMRDGYVSVRDVGFIDDAGFLHIVDRADDMIISGGVNVYPAETETMLGTHPNVSEVAVVGVPDPKWGERIVAAVVARGEINEDDLIAWAKDNVAYAAVPKEVRFVDALPRNDIGKVDKRAIASQWQ